MRSLTLALLLCLAPGCTALIDAGFRELLDDGPNPTYAHQSYWDHVEDSAREDSERECAERRETVIVVHHRH